MYGHEDLQILAGVTGAGSPCESCSQLPVSLSISLNRIVENLIKQQH